MSESHLEDMAHDADMISDRKCRSDSALKVLGNFPFFTRCSFPLQ